MFILTNIVCNAKVQGRIKVPPAVQVVTEN